MHPPTEGLHPEDSPFFVIIQKKKKILKQISQIFFILRTCAECSYIRQFTPINGRSSNVNFIM